MHRRTFLAGASAALSVALAGCSSESNARPGVFDDPRDPITDLPDDATTDFDVRSLRVPGEEHVVAYLEDETGEVRQHSRFFLTEPDDVDLVRFETEPDGTDEVLSFLESTDYDERTVVVHQRGIEECYERRVEYVQIRPERYRAQFCRTLRPATTPCEAGATEMEALFLRIPHAYEDSPRRTGSGESSRCPSRYAEVRSR